MEMQFEGLAKIGDPIEFAKYFSNGADQILFKILLHLYIAEIIRLMS